MIPKYYQEDGNEIGYPVTTISDNAFEYTDITSATIPSSVNKIGDWAFCECNDMVAISIPSSVKTIGEEGTFGYCRAI